MVLADGWQGANGDGGAVLAVVYRKPVGDGTVVLADGYRCVNGDGEAVPTTVGRRLMQDGGLRWRVGK